MGLLKCGFLFIMLAALFVYTCFQLSDEKVNNSWKSTQIEAVFVN